jgi:hypothetical protein
VWYESKRAGLDTGPGAGPDQVESAFRKFAREPGRRARLHAGDARSGRA